LRKKKRAPESIETEDTRGRASPESTGPLRLVISTSSDLTSVPLVNGRKYMLGREEADIVIADGSVSRTHAELILDEEGLTIVDRGSRNGTKVGGVEIAANQPMRIPLGTAFMVGSATLIAQRGRALERPALPANHVVRSKSMIDLYATLDVVARSEISVLILGETGTGKELIAEYIHERSARSVSGKLLRINCAALPESILDAELFGYERGAFTGATTSKIGLLESADKGTLFLDEVGELPLTVQAKLLRFLEQREVVRLGSVTPRIVDVRIVSATHRDLRNNESFRPDLFFRLDGISAHVPPLRERREEIIPLADLFIARAANTNKGVLPRLSDSARSALENHSFPGNVRELKSAIERAVVLASGASSPTIEAAHLMLHAHAQGPRDVARLDSEIETLERQRIIEALESCNGNQSEAARKLGISRHTLMSRMDVFGLERPKKKK
jgi:two-component system, NtrC family, response regulator AtoC